MEHGLNCEVYVKGPGAGSDTLSEHGNFGLEVILIKCYSYPHNGCAHQKGRVYLKVVI
jgi:ribosomal protein S11